MKLDYTPAEKAYLRSAGRSLLAVVLCAISLSFLFTHEVTATRPTLQSVPVDEATTAIPGASDALALDRAQQEAASGASVPAASEWSSLIVKPGETISALIEAHGMQTADWTDLMAMTNKDVQRLKNLHAGDAVLLRRNAEGRLAELQYELDESHTLHVQRDASNQLHAEVLAAEIERRTTQVSGLIENSLFVDGQRAGLSNTLIMDLADVFGYDIDFALDLRQGDRFSVIYEELYKKGEKLRDGTILAAEFINQGHTYRAVRYVDNHGQIAYYTPTGLSLRKAFFRTPLDVVRISSGFNLHRRHPILNIIRAHTGVDYAAAQGTPVKATGDAKVAFVGVKNGYGNCIVLQHGPQYSTLYGHLSRFREGLRVGASVNQGQVIGYVGHTGLATAPHLHYEFRINGVYVNPVTVTMPRAIGLSKPVLDKWQQQNQPLLAQLDVLSKSQVALGTAKAAVSVH